MDDSGMTITTLVNQTDEDRKETQELQNIAKEAYLLFSDFYNQRSWTSYPTWDCLSKSYKKFWENMVKQSFVKMSNANVYGEF